MSNKLLPGLIQQALLTAAELRDRYRFNPDGQLWKRTPAGWICDGTRITQPTDREDFLLAKLRQEDR